MMPAILGERLFDNFFGWEYPVRHSMRVDRNDLMRTDVKEDEKGYQLKISIPGFAKEDIQAELKDGYLTVRGTTTSSNEEKDEQTGRYIRRERYTGSCSRSFYVGEEVTQDEIKAMYENGVLDIRIPKKEARQEVEQRKYIAIEG